MLLCLPLLNALAISRGMGGPRGTDAGTLFYAGAVNGAVMELYTRGAQEMPLTEQ